MRKERLARGWSLREFSARTGINIGHASRIENGKRPPTENVAAACDAAFPERKGWFTEYYEELSTWSEVPAAFKDWTEHAMVSRLAGYYCLEKKGAIQREAEP